MFSQFHYRRLGILLIFVFLFGCKPDSDHYSPKIQAIKSYQSKNVTDKDVYVRGSFVISPPPQGAAQLKLLAKMVSKQAEGVLKKYISSNKSVRIDYKFYEKTDVINENFTDIYDSWSSIMISPDSGEVPLTLSDIGKSHHLVSAYVSKSNYEGSACRFFFKIEIYHHYWIFGSRKEQFINKVMDMPCSEWHGWE